MLDLADIRLSIRKGTLRIRGKGRDGGKIRHLPVHPDLRQALQDRLEARTAWKGADTTAVFLNQRGGRLTDRAARDIIMVGLARRVVDTKDYTKETEVLEYIGEKMARWTTTASPSASSTPPARSMSSVRRTRAFQIPVFSRGSAFMIIWR
ncbi:hypothetical protein [Nonomuraea aurantiaca]|uniref:hypothetical protein n=1 Tax=Nonomuraea aurantiaca TaxID=2878562 RepID=UPI001CD97130|nr:hypothetical protein [Nonomuraea aurantiaca]MCA2230296.1 hypothetical protein [Nonomuraea aurantiaca]